MYCELLIDKQKSEKQALASVYISVESGKQVLASVYISVEVANRL